MSSNTLFKYYPPDSFDFIVTSKGISIRFSQPESLNDPFESFPVLKHRFYGDKHRGFSSFSPIDEYKPINQPEIDTDYISDFYSAINNSIGILSLSKKGDSRPMWSYYSKDHTGFVIEFSYIEAGLKEIKTPSGSSGSVVYKKDRPESQEEYTSTSIFSSALYKDDQWEHEEEYRILAELNCFLPFNTDKNGFPLFTLTLPYKYIKKITLGVRATKELERKALFYIKNYAPNASLDRNTLCPKSYNLKPMTIWKGRTTDTPST
ncbi:DUF2971 domain-containing protein [Marinomonas flavescens]|uniref:DUF2971 domain-containing protein n=1 Tax=Marinomonas flavescens TaxID=2529379 RepID=UPI00105416D7|nr:DUF2971 domain-containing protein [Marinomonas flavescens]